MALLPFDIEGLIPKAPSATDPPQSDFGPFELLDTQLEAKRPKDREISKGDKVGAVLAVLSDALTEAGRGVGQPRAQSVSQVLGQQLFRQKENIERRKLAFDKIKTDLDQLKVVTKAREDLANMVQDRADARSAQSDATRRAIALADQLMRGHIADMEAQSAADKIDADIEAAKLKRQNQLTDAETKARRERITKRLAKYWDSASGIAVTAQLFPGTPFADLPEDSQDVALAEMARQDQLLKDEARKRTEAGRASAARDDDVIFRLSTLISGNAQEKILGLQGLEQMEPSDEAIQELLALEAELEGMQRTLGMQGLSDDGLERAKMGFRELAMGLNAERMRLLGSQQTPEEGPDTRGFTERFIQDPIRSGTEGLQNLITGLFGGGGGGESVEQEVPPAVPETIDTVSPAAAAGRRTPAVGNPPLIDRSGLTPEEQQILDEIIRSFSKARARPERPTASSR